MATAPGPAPVRTNTPAERAELILAQMEQLPTLPAVATRVLQITTSPDSNARDLVAIIEADQALTAKILALVRRADLGVSRNVTTVAQAVVMLGFSAIRNAVLSVQIYETFAAAEPGVKSAMDRAEFWKHSLAVACTAQLIAKRARVKTREGEAFVCGLLHDLGKVALDACLPKSYDRIIRETNARRACICDVERSILGLDHTTAGKRLARQWKLPEAIAECVWLHHTPPNSLPPSLHAPQLVEVVHLADEVVRRQRIGYSGYNRTGDISALARRIGLDDEAITQIVADIGPEVEQHCELVGLGNLTSSDMYARALVDANEELARLNETLTETNRELEVRSGCFEALREFGRLLEADGTLLSVCRAAARCIKDPLRIDGDVVCFRVNETRNTFYVGTSASGPDASAVLAVGSDGATDNVPSPGQLIPVPTWARPVTERFADLLDGGPTWMLPAMHSGRLVGGVLFTAPSDTVDRVGRHPQELEALGCSFGLAMVTAAVRAESETLIEELADVNRRLYAAQEELLQSKSLGMIAAMAAGAAHELNNPLAVISGRAQLLAGTVEDDKQKKTLHTIHEHAQRASDIVTELLGFAKPDPPKPVTVSLVPWLEQFRQKWLTNSDLQAEQFQISFADAGIAVRVDPDQLTCIFDAVVTNAVQAMPPENARLVVNSDSRASDDTIVLSVVDNGCGMSPDVAEHAFDPFFSHRAAGRGRGLGLSRAHSLTLSNGGRLWLESVPGAGTTVYVALPATQPGPA